MSKNIAKATQNTSSKTQEVKAKGIRSDRIQRTRRRGDPKLLAHTYAAGKVDKGAKNSPFVVVSRSKSTGLIMETRHRDEIKARKAEMGRKTYHHIIAVRDETDLIAARIEEERRAQAKADKEAAKKLAAENLSISDIEILPSSTACRDELGEVF